MHNYVGSAKLYHDGAPGRAFCTRLAGTRGFVQQTVVGPPVRCLDLCDHRGWFWMVLVLGSRSFRAVPIHFHRHSPPRKRCPPGSILSLLVCPSPLEGFGSSFPACCPGIGAPLTRGRPQHCSMHGSIWRSRMVGSLSSLSTRWLGVSLQCLHDMSVRGRMGGGGASIGEKLELI